MSIVWTGVAWASVLQRSDAAATEGLSFLGLHIDHHKNETATGDLDITAPGATARTLVILAREDLEIVRQVREVLS